MSVTDEIPIARNGDHPEPDAWEPVRLHELDPLERQQPTLGGFGIVYPGERHVFTGPPESAKTLAAYAIALETIRTGALVCVIDFEMGRYQALQRLIDLGATLEELARIIYVDPSEPATMERIQRLVALQPMLVIIDAAAGAYVMQGLDDNSRTDVERFVHMYVNPFWKANIATIVIDHVTKSVETRGRFAIGSERKTGSAFVHLGFEILHAIRRGSTGTYKVINHKDRGGWLERGTIAELLLTSDPETHQISWEWQRHEPAPEDEPFRPTVLMQRVSSYLSKQREAVSLRTIQEDVKGGKDHLRTAAERLTREGYAAETEGARHARMFHHITLFMGQEPPHHDRTTTAPWGGDSDCTTAPSSIEGAVRSGEDAAEPHHRTSGAVDVYDEDIQHLLDQADF